MITKWAVTAGNFAAAVIPDYVKRVLSSSPELAFVGSDLGDMPDTYCYAVSEACAAPYCSFSVHYCTLLTCSIFSTGRSSQRGSASCQQIGAPPERI